MPEPTKTTWWTKVTPYVLGASLWLVLSNLYNCAFPDHPAPAAIEADGKTYVACSTPDTGRGWFHSTYYADFRDNNGQTISLRGIEKLTVTNLPQKIDAPMPSNPVAVDGKTYREGAEYTWADGTKARVENGKWAPVKIKNTVCESDDDREKREARESAAREAEQKKEAEAAAAKLADTCKEWEQKHPLGSPVGSALDGAMMGSPDGCEGQLETAYNEKMKKEQASLEATKRKTSSVPTDLKKYEVKALHWATVVNAYGTEIYKRCYFNAGDMPCGYDNGRWGKIASLHNGDRVQVVSAKGRSASGTEIYEVRFQSWVGWMDAATLTLDTE